MTGGRETLDINIIEPLQIKPFAWLDTTRVMTESGCSVNTFNSSFGAQWFETKQTATQNTIVLLWSQLIASAWY